MMRMRRVGCLLQQLTMMMTTATKLICCVIRRTAAGLNSIASACRFLLFPARVNTGSYIVKTIIIIIITIWSNLVIQTPNRELDSWLQLLL